MSKVLNDIFDDIKIFKPQKFENMTIIGLNVKTNNKIDLMSLKKGLELGLVEITEVNESGTVSEVKVVNDAVVPLLILDGEEIIGSKQNRIVNTTIIIPAHSEKIIPVSCTEAGRWNYNSEKFKYSQHMATSHLRREKLESVNHSLRSGRQFESNQSEVWDNISRIEKNLKVNSSTRALDDSYKQKSVDIEEYKKEFTVQKNQNGLVVYINGHLVGFEVIYNTNRYKEYHEKLVESYILDAISMRNEERLTIDITENEFIDQIKNSEYESYDSVGLGVDYRVDNDILSGSAVIYENNLINASFFKKVDV